MTEKQAQKIFDTYNPVSAVTRCPNGRAPARKLIDLYARAAVNLYFVISKKEFVEIFNSQNVEQTNVDEVFTLLLPLVLKSKWYCFYKDYIVHYWAMEDFDKADGMLKAQGSKPRFIPEKPEFLKYEKPYYEDETQMRHWNKLREFIHKEWPEDINRYRFSNELKDVCEFGLNPEEAFGLLGKYNLGFSDEKRVQAFLDLLTSAGNNIRLWVNKGHSPNELFEIFKNRPQKESKQIVLRERKNVGPNAPCPCGSGKKYKKCCRLIEDCQTAQLSFSECALFFETWYGLLGFVNEQKKIVAAEIEPVFPNPASDEQLYSIRQALWESPKKLINDYLGSADLPKEKVELLLSWRDRHKKGMFFLVDYLPEYAVAIGSDEQGKDVLYGIKGLSRSIADLVQRELPTQIETVLLPFKDKIIYDAYISSMNVCFGDGAKNSFRQMYKKALDQGVISSLK